MEKKVEKRKRVKKGSRNDREQSLYERIFNDKERIDFKIASDVEGIDDEIAILRLEIKKAISGGDVSNLKTLVAATKALERLIRTRHEISREQGKGLKESITNILRDAALPLGISVGTDIIGKKMNQG